MNLTQVIDCYSCRVTNI